MALTHTQAAREQLREAEREGGKGLIARRARSTTAAIEFSLPKSLASCKNSNNCARVREGEASRVG